MSDLLNADFALVEKDTLYRCLDKLVGHKDELFNHLARLSARIAKVGLG